MLAGADGNIIPKFKHKYRFYLGVVCPLYRKYDRSKVIFQCTAQVAKGTNDQFEIAFCNRFHWLLTTVYLAEISPAYLELRCDIVFVSMLVR